MDAWTTVGALVEYKFGPNALGYDITGIQSIASWEGAGFFFPAKCLNHQLRIEG
jgi:hypothetical protein